MIGLGPEDYTYYPFKYDPTRHNDFKRACRHMLSPASLPASTLSAKFADLLRQGLAPFDMDDRWEGNLSDSVANKDSQEVVVRLYRTWTSALIYEARYRPQREGGTLTLYEFAYESDKRIYQSSGLQHELESYQNTLAGPILSNIIARQANTKNFKAST